MWHLHYPFTHTLVHTHTHTHSQIKPSHTHTLTQTHHITPHTYFKHTIFLIQRCLADAWWAKKNERKKSTIRTRKKFLAVVKACMDIFWPTPVFLKEVGSALGSQQKSLTSASAVPQSQGHFERYALNLTAPQITPSAGFRQCRQCGNYV